jgi:prophage DNA circulation protein
MPTAPKKKPTPLPSRDILSQLLECSFRGISFPVESLDVNFAHDVIQHKRMDRDGAKLENTGMGALSYNVKAPFCNSIAKGPMETWSNLYPDTKNKMLEALQDRTTGDFIHPELGLRRCKASNVHSALDPNYRSGVVLTFALIEDTEDDDAVSITANSTVSIAKSAAVSLDAKIAKLKPPIKTGLEEDGLKSFTDAIDKIGGAFDQVGLLQKQVIGKIDKVIGRINKLSDTISDTIGDLGTAPDQLIASLLMIKKNALVQPKPLGFYQTKAKTTVNQLCIQFRNSVQELVTLNPDLASASTVKAFTIIRYYKK